MSVEIMDMTLDQVAAGPVQARIYKGGEFGKGPPVLIYFHGGSFMEAGLRDSAVAACIASTGAIVVVPDYNTPLGGVFPKPLEVGFSLFSYLAKKRAGLGDRKSLLLVGGEEAGGNVAAAVALKARDYYADELDGQVLFSPLLDPFMGSQSMRKADAIGMRERWADGWNHYLSAGRCHPYAAPSMCSRLSGMAPALVMSAEDDPLLDESVGYCQKLAAAGVKVRKDILPEGTGWVSIYGGKTNQVPVWEEHVRCEFNGFVKEVAIQ
ncbi:alpha/beta hydrolase [Ciceribacter sp. L1K22]|uniref:alpha/beta hydrolase fold domain-containing protein n=1 Tax=Ciceribacter sp. L1K22 TaxID=2820275 RepID=UPI001ABE3627|nr:alpha/beta hydrolase [Ciceribacter sp. L1K22]MBO3762307.1 alpha/beta hydrolase [Ciceribacter sp. L1K22]